ATHLVPNNFDLFLLDRGNNVTHNTCTCGTNRSQQRLGWLFSPIGVQDVLLKRLNCSATHHYVPTTRYPETMGGGSLIKRRCFGGSPIHEQTGTLLIRQPNSADMALLLVIGI